MGSIILSMKPKEITQGMLEDLSKMGDKEWAEKYNTFRQYPIRLRKKRGIASYNIQHNTKLHKIAGGIEYKWCPMGGGHWDTLNRFSVSKSRFDGLRGICKEHDKEVSKKSYRVRDGAKVAREWSKTPSGRESKRTTWRKEKAKKLDAYVLWTPEHEHRAYEYFGEACAYCGVRVPFLKIEFDHFVPVSRSGKTHPSNMLPCCKKCNHGVGGKFSKDVWEWLLEKFGEDRAKYVYNVCKDGLEILGNNLPLSNPK